MRRFPLLGSVLAIAALTVLSAGAAQQVTVRDLLRDIAEASDSDWAAVTRGEPFAKVLATDSREIAVAGAVRIAASSERLVDRYREVENLKRSAIVLDLGRLSKPPRPADLATVPLEDYSLDLKDCRPGECRVRLGEPEIARFHREVDWRAANWRERSQTVWTRGPGGIRGGLQPRRAARRCPRMPTSEEPLSVPAELSLLVGRFGFLNAFAPAFYAYLREFGPGGPDGLDEVMYWSKEDFGVRPVLRLSAPDDLPGFTPSHPDCHQPDLRRPLSRRRPHADHDDRRLRGRRQARLLHGVGQPRPHALARRHAALVRPLDGAESQPRRAAKDPGVDEGEPRAELTRSRLLEGTETTGSTRRSEE